MILRSSNVLGVSLSDRTVSCAEVAVSGGKRVVRRLATYVLPGELSFDKPDALGAALGAFLKANGFTASRAAVGIPAKWLIAMEKELPPAPENEARSMLRLQAERLAVSDSGEMVFDYAGRIQPNQSNKVLLVGLLRQRLTQIETMFEAARVSVTAVTSSALALAQGARGADHGLPMLLLGRQGAEMVWRHEGTPRMLRHVLVMAVNSHGPVTLGPLGSELGRALALTRANGNTTAASDLMLWDGVGLSGAQVNELAERSGVRVHASDAMTMLNLEPSTTAVAEDGTMGERNAGAVAESFAPAIALAAAAADRELLPLDFTRSQLTPRRVRKVGARTSWGVVGAALLILLIGGLYYVDERRQSELDGINADLDGKKAKIQDAQTIVGRMDYTKGYFDARPPLLECLRELTLSFRDDERIWTTTLSLREEERRTEKEKKLPPIRKGQLQGKAYDSTVVYTMLDRLRKNPKFQDVKLQKVADVGGKSREVTFSATFNFIASE
jgi:hypothetical protein